MSEVKIVKAWLGTAENPARVSEVAGLDEVATGWIAKVSKDGGTVTFRIAAFGSNGQPALTGVRSISPPSAAEPEVLTWAVEGDEFVSPVFGHGYDFRLEVDTAAESPVPVGGGHFRVVEEAGG